MPRIFLRVRAPFAAYRPLQAGVFRGSSPTIPHSAAYGLVLNLACIETRGDSARPVTTTRTGLPALRIAVGEVTRPGVATIYQQLHGYPVGNSSKELAEGTRGAKYHIAPARREVLVGLDVVVAVESTDAALFDRVRAGLRGELGEPRYGLPFAGDNNLLFDRIEVHERPPEKAHWYVPVRIEDGPRAGSARLTLAIDRDDSSKTRAGLFAPESEASDEVPQSAWVWTPAEPQG